MNHPGTRRLGVNLLITCNPFSIGLVDVFTCTSLHTVEEHSDNMLKHRPRKGVQNHLHALCGTSLEQCTPRSYGDKE